MAARPHIFTWLFMLLTLTIIRAGNKHLFWLPVITVIWANLHGGFILGIVLQGIFICGNVINEVSFRGNSLRERFTRQKRPLLVMALCTLSVGLNPFGYELLLFPFQVSKGVFSTLIGEWASPDLKSMWYFTAYLFFSAVLLLIPKSKATWTDRLLFLFFLQASLTHIRHISIMTMAMTPSLAMMFSNVFFRRQSASNTNPKQQLKLSSKTGPLLTVTAAVMVISIIVINPHTRGLLSPLEIFSAPKAELQQLSAYLDSNPPRGRMFNEYNLWGYLLYSLGSQAKVFIDGRADMYGEQIISDYNTIQSEQSGREELLKKYSIDWIVFDKHSTIIHDLGQSGHWRETFSNNRYAVLIRR